MDPDFPPLSQTGRGRGRGRGLAQGPRNTPKSWQLEPPRTGSGVTINRPPPPPPSRQPRGRGRGIRGQGHPEPTGQYSTRGRGHGRGQTQMQGQPKELPLLSKEDIASSPQVDWSQFATKSSGAKTKRVEGVGVVVPDGYQARLESKGHPKGPPIPGKEEMVAAREYFQGTDLERDLFYSISTMQNVLGSGKKSGSDFKLQKTLAGFYEEYLNDLNPYFTILSVISKCPDYISGKNGLLATKILANFEAKLRSLSPSELRDLEDRHLSLEFCTRVYQRFVDGKNNGTMTRIFKLCRLNRFSREFLPVFRDYLPPFDFRKLAEVILALELRELFPFDEILKPLLVENHGDLLESYVKGNKTMQIEVVRFLDDLQRDNIQKVSDLFKGHPGGKNNSCSRLSGKPLNKFIDKLLDKFDLDPSHAPITSNNKKHGAFRYLVGTKEEEKMRLENWRDLVMQAVKDDDALQYKLIEYLTGDRVTSYDLDEAVYWTKTLDLDLYRVPSYVRDEVKNPQAQVQPEEEPEEDWEEEIAANASTMTLDNGWANDQGSKYYQLSLPKSQIEMVDTRQSFLNFLNQMENEVLSGMDAEFRPTSVMSQDVVALIQIAVPDRVYLIDVNALVKVLEDRDWVKFQEVYFDSKGLRILGYGLSNDFKVIGKSIKAMAGLHETAQDVLDLELVYRHTCMASTAFLQPAFLSENKGLSGLVESLFGLPMDKRDQISDWDKRPLTQNQFTYAALDAFVLIDIYNKIYEMAQARDKIAEIEKIVKDLIKSRNRPPKVKAAKPLTPAEKKLLKEERQRAEKEAQEGQTPLNEKPIEVKDVKFVCDNMLQALCKKLRIQGLDAISIESFESVERVGELARTEDRIILTKRVYNVLQLKKWVLDPRHCYKLYTDKADDQVEEVLKYFNINVSEDDLFSRCVLCNGGSYLTVDQKTLSDLRERRTAAQETGARSNYCPDYDDGYDDYGGFDDGFDTYEEDDFGPPAPKVKETWVKVDGGEFNADSGLIRNTAVEVKVLDVHPEVMTKVETFFVCRKCGKVYWKGSHWDKVKSRAR